MLSVVAEMSSCVCSHKDVEHHLILAEGTFVPQGSGPCNLCNCTKFERYVEQTTGPTLVQEDEEEDVYATVPFENSLKGNPDFEDFVSQMITDPEFFSTVQVTVLSARVTHLTMCLDRTIHEEERPNLENIYELAGQLRRTLKQLAALGKPSGSLGVWLAVLQGYTGLMLFLRRLVA